jgi:hypothetical protein
MQKQIYSVSNEALKIVITKEQRFIVYLNNNETQNFLQVKVFVCELPQIYEDNNTFGDLSAILIENMPIWAEFSSTPSNRISLMSDGKQKYVLSMITREESPVLQVSLLGCLS